MKNIAITILLILSALTGCNTKDNDNKIDILPGSFPEHSIFNGPYLPASSNFDITLPTGEWHLIANGRIYDFKISRDSSGKLLIRSRLGDIEPIWDPKTAKLMFKRTIKVANQSYSEIVQNYTGYLMAYGKNPSSGKLDYKWRLAGTFTQESPKIVRPQSGWYATMSR